MTERFVYAPLTTNLNILVGEELFQVYLSLLKGTFFDFETFFSVHRVKNPI
jgi:hypothetical protein